MNESNPSIRITKATPEDLSQLVELFASAWLPGDIHTDPVGTLKNDCNPTTRQHYEDMFEPPLKGYLTNKKCTFLKASVAGEQLDQEIIAGSLCYARYAPAEKDVDSNPSTHDNPPPSLNQLVGRDLDVWHRKYMQGKLHYMICIMSVNPSHQSRGVGSALVKYMTDLADQEDQPLPCWVHSGHEEKSKRFYRKCGFQEVGKDTYDMDKYLTVEAKEQLNGEKLGTFSHTYLMRLPRPSTYL